MQQMAGAMLKWLHNQETALSQALTLRNAVPTCLWLSAFMAVFLPTGKQCCP